MWPMIDSGRGGGAWWNRNRIETAARRRCAAAGSPAAVAAPAHPRRAHGPVAAFHLFRYPGRGIAPPRYKPPGSYRRAQAYAGRQERRRAGNALPPGVGMADRAPEPELAGLPADLARHFRGITERRLEPLFRTEIRRTTLRVRGDDWRADLALDVGELVAAGNGARRRCANSRSNSSTARPPGSTNWPSVLRTACPCAWAPPANRTGDTRWWEKKRRSPASGGRRPGPAGFGGGRAARARGRLRRAIPRQRRLPARDGRPEAVHQMRVALRRLRSAISVFRGYVAPRARPRWRRR